MHLFCQMLVGFLALVSVQVLAAKYSDSKWETFGGDPGRTQYSSLEQINTGNVDKLKVAWRYETGDADPQNSQIQCNPIIVDGVLYGTTSKLKVFALEAATGAERWKFDPYKGENGGQGVNRGVTYWRKGENERILFTAGTYLYALNAETGEPITSFGAHGRVDLRTGFERDLRTLQVDATSPGAIYRDLIILGSRVGETPAAAPGHIRAFNIITGELAWVFHTIPHPGEFGYDTWPEAAWQRSGGANAWAAMSVDTERGIVFVPTGSAAYDFYGGDRHGDNLFANTLIALDAATGKRRWHFQTVHHDLWDRDLPAAPNLITIERDGAEIDAVAQVTKTGYVFVFDRVTGAPLFPIEERPVPRSEVPGEHSSPTQPAPLRPPPFTRQSFTRDEVTDISPRASKFVLQRLAQVRNGHMFLPPSAIRETVLFPGFDGGPEWGGAAWDPETRRLYVNATELPWTYKLVKIESGLVDPGVALYGTHCATCHGLDRRGNGRDMPGLEGIGQKLSYPQIGGIIRRGKGRMPANTQLSFEDMLLLLDYLNTPLSETGKESVSGKTTVVTTPRYLHDGYFPFYDEQGYPAIRPPWGTLTAIDLEAGDIAWQIPLGEHAELTAQGIPITGTENYGGPVVTKGGVIFIAATMDEKLRALDKNDGRVLWTAELSAGGFATPSIYAVNGKQFVVIAAGGGKLGRKSGGEYIAFALPD